jgi:UDP-N-acetylglucosamine 4,6-dehydratase
MKRVVYWLEVDRKPSCERAAVLCVFEVRGTERALMLNDKVILVTGGTGSFGRKFAEIVLREYAPRVLRILSRGELLQYEMRKQFPNESRIRFLIGDVRDRNRLYRAMNGVDIVIHAAALKQVPACEYNPLEAIRTNVDGATNVIDAAIDNGVDRVVALSTDKAVHPVNLYGATKLVAEKLLIQANAYSGKRETRFSCVRYGNVVGSRGSVIPLFLQQRRDGLLTVTDERMTRFWISLEQGVRFVIRCVAEMRGGEVFVPKIASMNIMELVQAIAPDCHVKKVGIRPGEKLHEMLVSEDEARHTLELDDMFVIQPLHPWWATDNWSHAKHLPDGFQYASDTNSQWLSLDELEAIIENLTGEDGREK